MSEVATTQAYNYAALPAADARFVKAAASSIRERGREAAAKVIEIGTQLVAVKNKLPHGDFGAWIEAEFGWSNRTAQRYMQAAALEGKSDTVSYLPPTTIYAITAAIIPEAARDELVKWIEADKPAEGAVSDKLATLRATARTERIMAKMKPRQRTTFAKRQAQMEDDREKAERRAAREEAALTTAVAMLREKLGDDMPALLTLLAQAGMGHTRLVTILGQR